MNEPKIFRNHHICGDDEWWLEIGDDKEGTDGYQIEYKEKSRPNICGRIFIPKEYLNAVITCFTSLKGEK